MDFLSQLEFTPVIWPSLPSIFQKIFKIDDAYAEEARQR